MTDWRFNPSRREQHLQWYLQLVMRYIVGPAIMGWELLADQGHNLLVLLVGAMLATSGDMLGVVRGLLRQARAEGRSLDQLLDDGEADRPDRNDRA